MSRLELLTKFCLTFFVNCRISDVFSQSCFSRILLVRTEALRCFFKIPLCKESAVYQGLPVSNFERELSRVVE